MPRFCRFCGTELKNPDARFCQTCGKPLAQPASPSPATADEQPRFVIRVPGQALWEVPLSKPIVTVGRTEDNDIILSPQYVSGHHSQIEQRGTVALHRPGSTNGTFVNGQHIRDTDLRDGDILRIGDTEGNSVSLTYRAAGAAGTSVPVVGSIRMGATALGMQSSLIIGRDPKADTL